MACKYTYNGKEYSEQEFKAILLDKVGEGEVTPETFKELFGVRESETTSKESAGKGKKRLRGTVAAFVERSDLPQSVKDRLVADERSYIKTLPFDEAQQLANAIISGYDNIDDAIEDARSKNSDIPLSLKSIIYGEGLKHYRELTLNAENVEDKNFYAEKENELHELMGETGTEAGRYSAYLANFYYRSGYAKVEKFKKELDQYNKVVGKNAAQQAKEVKDIFEDSVHAEEAVEQAIEEAVGNAIKEKEARIKELEALLERARKAPRKTGSKVRKPLVSDDAYKNALKEFRGGKLSANPFLDPEKWKALSIIAAYHLERGYYKFEDFYKRMRKDVKDSDEYLLELYESAKAKLIEDGIEVKEFDSAADAEVILEQLTNDAKAAKEKLAKEKAEARETAKWGGSKKGLEDLIKEALIEAGFSREVGGKTVVDWKKVVIDSKDVSPTLKKIKEAVKAKGVPSGVNIDKLFESIERQATELLVEKKKKAVQNKANQILSWKSRKLLGRVKRNTRIQTLVEIWRQGGLTNKVILEKLASDFGIIEFASADEQYIASLVEQIDTAPLGATKERLEERLQAFLEYTGSPRFITKSLIEYLKSGLLTGITTQFKNVIGGIIEGSVQTSFEILSAQLSKKGIGDKEVLKVVRDSLKKGLINSADVLLNGGIDLGTAMSETTGNKEGSPSIRFMENPRARFEEKPSVTNRVTEKSQQIMRIMIRAMSAMDTAVQSSLQDIRSYTIIKANLMAANPLLSNKEASKLAYETLYSQDIEEARQQATKEYFESVEKAKERFNSAQEKVDSLTQKRDKLKEKGESTAVVEEDLKSARTLRSRYKKDLEDLQRSKTRLSYSISRRTMEIIEQKVNIEVRKEAQLYANEATYKSRSAGVASTAALMVQIFQKAAINLFASTKAKILKEGGNPFALSVIEYYEFVVTTLLAWQIPFIKTVGNILERGFEYFPIYGAAKGTVFLGLSQIDKGSIKNIAGNITARKAAEIYYRAAIGLFAYSILNLLADWEDDEEEELKNIRIYGEGSENWKQDFLLKQARPDNTIVIGGHKVPFDLFGSFQVPLKIQAAYLDAQRYGEDYSLGTTILSLAGNLYGEKLANTIRSVKNDKTGRMIEKEGAELLTRFMVPSVQTFRQVGQMVSPEAKVPLNFGELLLKNIGLVGFVDKPAIDYRGRTYDMGEMYTASADGFIKTFVKEDKTDEIDKIVFEHNASLMPISATDELLFAFDEEGNVEPLSDKEVYEVKVDAANYLDTLLKAWYENQIIDIPERTMKQDEEYIKKAEGELIKEGKSTGIADVYQRANEIWREDYQNQISKKIGDELSDMNSAANELAKLNYYEENNRIIPISLLDAKQRYYSLLARYGAKNIDVE